MSKEVFVSGAFDDLRFRDFRFLEELAKQGPLHVKLWSDELALRATGKAPKFPFPEREYLLQSIRYVSKVECLRQIAMEDATPKIDESILDLVPPPPPAAPSSRKTILVTGCYDWFHSGHVRFFEECSELGDLYVVVGHDENVRLLKGEGHPLFPATQRRYLAGSIRYVAAALISTGQGWLDAEPEIRRIKPDFYAVNEDGDKPEKREFCEKNGIGYKVLKRLPKEGLIRRTSTNLRGF